ncbi:MAG: sugar ABC transporter permease [Candidatus Bathyarchaeia archaeon]
MSLSDWDGFSPIFQSQFVGLKNFIYLIRDDVFQICLKNTIIYTLLNIPLTLGIALGIALLLNLKVKFRAVFRTMFFAPTYTSIVTVSIIWIYMYHPYYGLFNEVLSFFGLPRLLWLRGANTSLISCLIMNLWMWAGYNSIITLAGLQDIPQVYYEAAEVDGASIFARFRYITLPLLKPVLLYQLVVISVTSFQVFTSVFVLTQGGPGNSSNVLALYMYNLAFQWGRFSLASAIAIMLFLISLLLTLIEIRLLRKGGVVWW